MVRTSSTTPEDEKNQSDPLALIFIHILTYLEEELARRHWKRLLRATSTSAIFTVSLYKKVLIKMSLRWGAPGHPESSKFHLDPLDIVLRSPKIAKFLNLEW